MITQQREAKDFSIFSLFGYRAEAKAKNDSQQ